MENIPILLSPPSPPISFADQYFILSLCVVKELCESHSLMKEVAPSNYSISAIFFDKFPLMFHLNETIPTPSLTVDFLEKLKTHEFILDEFVKEDYYLSPPEALNTDNIFHLASATLGYSYEKTWKTVKKLVRVGLVANTDSSNIHTYSTTTDKNNMVQQTIQYIRSTYGDGYVKETGESSLLSNHDIGVNKCKEAIYPASAARLPTPEDDPLYTLIWERSIQSSMKPAYYHRYRLKINTPMPNMTFVHCLEVPILRGWTKMASSLMLTPINNSKHVIHPTTSHNVLLYLHSLNRSSPIYCKRVIAESRVSPEMKESTEQRIAKWLTKDGVVGETKVSLQMTGFTGMERREMTLIGIEEGGVVDKLKELGIGMEAIGRAGFFQTHKRMGLVKDVAAEGGGGEGFVLSFDKGREIELFKETRMSESKETTRGGNRIVLSELGMACAEHFHNAYRYLLDSKEYITGANNSQMVNKGWGRILLFGSQSEPKVRSKNGGFTGGEAPNRGNLGFPTDDRIFRSATKENEMEENISNELNNYMTEIIEKHKKSSLANSEGGCRSIGVYRGTELKIKRDDNGEGGYYLEWGKEPHLQRKALESVPSSPLIPFRKIQSSPTLLAPATLSFEDLTEERAIEIIERGMKELEKSADYKRVFRVLDPYTSIRHGKFGTYIYHRTEEMKKTKFISLKNCPFNYMTAPTEEIMEWVYQRVDEH